MDDNEALTFCEISSARWNPTLSSMIRAVISVFLPAVPNKPLAPDQCCLLGAKLSAAGEAER